MSERDAFERVVDGLNEAMFDDASWAETSELIDEVFRAKGNVLVFADEHPKGDIEVFFAKCYFRGIDRSAWVQEYFRDYYAEDEHPPRLRVLPDATIVPLAELYSDEERKTSRAYNEVFRRFGGRKGLIMLLDGPVGSRITWGIADPVDTTGWSSSQFDMVARVIPHIRQYVRVRSTLVEAGALGGSAVELLGNTRTGVIQLDLRGRIVEANARAREMLLRNDGLSAGNGELRAAMPAGHDRLERLLARALPRFGEQATSSSMLARRPSGLANLVLHVTPVRDREGAYRSRGVAALVLIVDPAARVGVKPALVQRVLGLTPVESEIAVLLAEGRTARQIAAATGRGYGTVRTHVKHMLAKLGVSRQVEVVQLVLALSSFPASRD